MKYVVNVQSKQPDIDPRSLRARVKDRDKAVLRDTYFLIDPEESPSKGSKWVILLFILPEGPQAIPMMKKRSILSFQVKELWLWETMSFL